MDSFASATAVALARQKFKEGGQKFHEQKATQVTVLNVPFRQSGSGKAAKTRKIKLQPRLGKVAADCSEWLGLGDLQRDFDGLLQQQTDLRAQVLSPMHQLCISSASC